MTVFISGKITNYAGFWGKFHYAEIKLINQGFTVLNPADTVARIKGLDHADYLHICFAMIDVCDTVAFLPNWKDSIGSKIERAYAEKLGKNIIYLEG